MKNRIKSFSGYSHSFELERDIIKYSEDNNLKIINVSLAVQYDKFCALVVFSEVKELLNETQRF